MTRLFHVCPNMLWTMTSSFYLWFFDQWLVPFTLYIVHVFNLKKNILTQSVLQKLEKIIILKNGIICSVKQKKDTSIKQMATRVIKLNAINGGWVHLIFHLFEKGDNFDDFLFAFLHTKPLLKSSPLQKERICSSWEQIHSFCSRPLFRRETKLFWLWEKILSF